MTEQHWWNQLEKDKFNFETFSIFADWLEDNVDIRSTIIREIIKNEYRPNLLNFPHFHLYEWWRQGTVPETTNDIIPNEIFKYLYKSAPFYRTYSTERNAYEDLINAMVKYANNQTPNW